LEFIRERIESKIFNIRLTLLLLLLLLLLLQVGPLLRSIPLSMPINRYYQLLPLLSVTISHTTYT